MKNKFLILFSVVFLFSCVTGNQIRYSFDDTYTYKSARDYAPKKEGAGLKVGIGIADVTAEASDQVMGGYVVSTQKTKGIHNRLMSRAFVFCDDNNNYATYVSVDEWSIALHVREEVAKFFEKGIVVDENGEEINLLDADGNPIFNTSNIMISSTHTHHGISGADKHEMFTFANGGFNQNLFDGLVNGIVLSIVKGYKNLEPARVEYSVDSLVGKYNANSNRSMEAFLNNKDIDIGISIEEYSKLSDEEKEKWNDHYRASNKNMEMLKFFSKKDDSPMGLVNWFAIHPTSMSAANRYVSGDSKGLASNMFERAMGNKYSDNNGFIAAFAQGPAGDITNLRKIWKKDQMDYCEAEELVNVEFSAIPQVAKAMEIFCQEGLAIDGEVASALIYVDYRNVTISDKFRYKPERYSNKTATSANGYSFARGSEIHSTNLAGIREGLTTDDENWKIGWVEFVRGLVGGLKNSNANIARIFYKDAETQAAHDPKPIMFNTSRALPEWMPPILPTQVLRIGNVVIVSTPFETTTVAGQRIVDNIYNEIEKTGAKIDKVIFSPYTNAYASYMTTPEEYEMQHYEGGSTLFGINQLPATMQETERVFHKMLAGKTGRDANDPEWVCDTIYDVEGKVKYQKKKNGTDTVLAGKSFGEQKSKLRKTNYKQGEQIEIKFYGSNLNNDPLSDISFVTVQRYIPELDKWANIANDIDYHTTAEWKKHTPNSSDIVGRWRIPYTANAGKYRMVCQGAYKAVDGEVYRYSNVSQAFEVENGVKIPQTSNFTKEADAVYNLTIDAPVSATKLILAQKPAITSQITYAEVEFDDGTKYPVANTCELGSRIEIKFPQKDNIKSCKLTVHTSSGDNKDLLEEFMLF